MHKTLISNDVLSLKDLAKLVCDRSLTGKGMELGVLSGGQFASNMLSTSSLTGWEGIDPFRRWDDHIYSELDQIALDAERRVAQRNYSAAKCLLTVRRASSVIDSVPDGSLDFLYVNAGHAFGGLADWWEKVRVGGVIAGEGYPMELQWIVDHTLDTVFLIVPEEGPPSWLVYR